MNERTGKLSAYWIVTILVMLVGFALRVYLLDSQSMWSDEGLSVYRARQSLSELFQNVITIDGIHTTDTNPPLYFLVLHFWQAITGESVLALRYQGVLTSMVALALMIPWVRLFASRRVAIVAAFFMAISPFHIWESQILRNYPLLIALNLLSVYGLFRFILRPGDRHRWRWLALWLLAGLLGIYTHYFAFFVFAYGLLSLGIGPATAWLTRQPERIEATGRRPSRRVLVPLGLALLLLIPAVIIGLERFAAGRQIDFQWVPPADVATHVVAAFAVGISRTRTHPWWLWLPAVLLALWGLAGAWRKSRAAALLLLGYLLIPLALLVLMSSFNPLYNGVRHLLFGLPPFIGLMALGVGEGLDSRAQTRARRVFFVTGIALALIVVVIQLNNLDAQFNDPSYVRDDVRGAARYLSQVATGDDLIVLHDTLIRPTFDYYYDGAAEVVAIPLFGEQDTAAAARRLLASGTARRIWFLTQPTPRTGFPREFLSRIANEEWLSIYKHQFPFLWLPVRLEAFTADITEPTLPASAQPVGSRFSNEWRLEGYELPTAIEAGAPWWGRFYLTPLGEKSAPYTLSLQLIDEDGQTWAQADEAILPGYDPSQWPAGEILRFDQEFVVPVGVPTGEYSVLLRILNDNGATLVTEAGAQEVALGTVTVDAGQDPEQLANYSPQPVRLGPIEFLGYRMSNADLRPGHILTLEAIWRARRTPEQDYGVKLELLDNRGKVMAETVLPLTRRSRPTSLWRSGDVIQGHLGLEIPTAATEDVTIRLTLLNEEDRPVGRSIELRERPSIVPWPLETQLPDIPYPLSAGFSGEDNTNTPLITLHGYDAPLAATGGDLMSVKLIWQSIEDLDRNLLVFVHLTDAAGNIVAQADGVPVNGTRLTKSWRAGEVLVDEHAVQLPADLLPGSYQLWTGFYAPESGARLRPQTGTTVWPDGRLPLAQLTIQESP